MVGGVQGQQGRRAQDQPLADALWRVGDSLAATRIAGCTQAALHLINVPAAPRPLSQDVQSVRFIRNTPGLRPLVDDKSSKLEKTRFIDRRLVQVVVAASSPLVGKTVRELQFRDHFNGVVVAISRQGERIQVCERVEEGGREGTWGWRGVGIMLPADQARLAHCCLAASLACHPA